MGVAGGEEFPALVLVVVADHDSWDCSYAVLSCMILLGEVDPSKTTKDTQLLGQAMRRFAVEVLIWNPICFGRGCQVQCVPCVRGRAPETQVGL